jgi:choline dehydrogenase
MMMVSLNRRGDALGSTAAATAATAAVGLFGVWVNQCRSRGAVHITSADPTVQPWVDERLLTARHDLVRLRDGLRRLLELTRHPGAQSLGTWLTALDPGSSDDELDRWARATASDTQHACGTCRMGHPDDDRSVVDPAGRVLGVDGLRVVDASLLPTITRANTHLVTVMLAEHIAAGWSGD